MFLYILIYCHLILNELRKINIAEVFVPGETPETHACKQVMLNTLQRDHRLDRYQIDHLMDSFRRVHADLKREDKLRSNGVPLADKFILALSRAFLEPVRQDEHAVCPGILE